MERSGGEVARLVDQEYQGTYLLHLRIYYRDHHGKLKPSPRRNDPTQLAPLRKALRKVEKKLASDAKPEDKTKKKKKWPAAVVALLARGASPPRSAPMSCGFWRSTSAAGGQHDADRAKHRRNERAV